jgi:hypothetical protein
MGFHPIVGAGSQVGAVAAEDRLFGKCGWAGCTQPPLASAVLCNAHVAGIIEEPLSNFASFLQMLPFMMNVTIAGNALYHAVHTAVQIGLFNRYLGHDLMRAAGASRGGDGVEATIEKLVASIPASDQGEFMMHLKRQLLVPERRSARREKT